MTPIFEDERPASRRLTRKDYKSLRGMFDGEDTTMTRGMSVRAPRRMQVHYRPEQDKPEAQFLYNNAGTQAFLLQNFPLLQDNRVLRIVDKQRGQARLWAAVIYHYFRQGWTDSRIERELLWKKGTVGYIVQQIRRKIKGLSPNGMPYSGRKRGRPRKIVALVVPETTTQISVKKAA